VPRRKLTKQWLTITFVTSASPFLPRHFYLQRNASVGPFFSANRMKHSTLGTASGHRKPAPLVVVELNEVNFDLVRKYLATHALPSLRQLVEQFDAVQTFAESRYEQLEPWIQWVSAHTGLTFDQHGVFRLGDGAERDHLQVFEQLENSGLRVGALSPMNSRNAMVNPAYFVPDPWTLTPSDGTGFSRRLTAMLRQTVNENAQGRVALSSLMTLFEAALRTAWVGNHWAMLKLVCRAKGRQWVKALVLDQLIHHVHLYQMRKHKPDASFVFFNAGAHIQHHYYFNSPHAQGSSRNPNWYVDPKADPMLEMLQTYDAMLADYLAMAKQGTRLIVATGLTQLPYDRVKFYYRIQNHADFLQRLGLVCTQVLPRMTRDFEVLFSSVDAARTGEVLLASAVMVRDGVKLFADIDNRGVSLFVTMTYPHEILPSDSIRYSGGVVDGLRDLVSFVAIKNGMHSTKGFAFVSPGSGVKLPQEAVHVSALFGITMSLMGLGTGHTVAQRAAPAAATSGL
jgi:hypothetical protein